MEVLDVGHGSASLILMMKGWMLVEIVSIVGTFYAGKTCLEGELIWRRNRKRISAGSAVKWRLTAEVAVAIPECSKILSEQAAVNRPMGRGARSPPVGD